MKMNELSSFEKSNDSLPALRQKLKQGVKTKEEADNVIRELLRFESAVISVPTEYAKEIYKTGKIVPRASWVPN